MSIRTLPQTGRVPGPFAISMDASGVGNSVRVWILVTAFLIAVQLFITFIGAGLERDPRAGLFAWPSLAAFAALGMVGIIFAHRTGFPSAWDARLSNRQRVLYPVAIGLGFGLLAVLIEQFTHGTSFFKEQTGSAVFNAPFPGSLLLYPGGAVLVEVLYRLLPIPLLLWVISNVLLRGRAQTPVFWSLALLTSLIEPVSQDLGAFRAGAVMLAVSQFVPDYAFNLTQAALFRRYGFLVAIAARVVDYLVWHVAYGNFVCAC
jgi:hypothetical protein